MYTNYKTAYAALANRGFLKTAASMTQTLLPRSTRAATQTYMKPVQGLRNPLHLPELPGIGDEPVQSYRAIMGAPQYRWPPSSKELLYRLHQQTPEALRTPINYAV